jgi:hypothetical protein
LHNFVFATDKATQGYNGRMTDKFTLALLLAALMSANPNAALADRDDRDRDRILGQRHSDRTRGRDDSRWDRLHDRRHGPASNPGIGTGDGYFDHDGVWRNRR